jgi:hypothetical protein
MVPGLLVVIAVYTVLTPGFGAEKMRPKISRNLFGCFFGAVLGFYDGFFGPGTGSFWMMALLSLLGLEMTGATAFTKVVNLSSNFAALLIFMYKGCVVMPAALAMIAGQLLGAQIGSGLVLKHGARIVRNVFLLVTFALALRLFWNTWF